MLSEYFKIEYYYLYFWNALQIEMLHKKIHYLDRAAHSAAYINQQIKAFQIIILPKRGGVQLIGKSQEDYW